MKSKLEHETMNPEKCRGVIGSRNATEQNFSWLHGFLFKNVSSGRVSVQPMIERTGRLSTTRRSFFGLLSRGGGPKPGTIEGGAACPQAADVRRHPLQRVEDNAL